MWVLVVLLALAVALLGVLVVGLLRTHAEVLRRLHELGAGIYDADADEAGAAQTSARAASTTGGVRTPVEIATRPGVPEPRSQDGPVGTDAHDVAGTTPAGAAAVAGVVGASHTTLLAFLSSGCGTCADFWRAFDEGAATSLPGRDTRLVVVTKGPEAESLSEVRRLAPSGVTTIMSSDAYTDYGVPASPYVVLVDGPSGRVIGEGAAATWAQVANLLGQAAADAGLDVDGSPLRPSPRRGRASGAERGARADRDLRAAGIGPGHPSLYPDSLVADDPAGSGVISEQG
jgi:hypothetical protein